MPDVTQTPPKTISMRLAVLIGVLFLLLVFAFLAPYALGDYHPAIREVWVQDELGKPVVGALAQSVDSRGAQLESVNIGVSDESGKMEISSASYMDYVVTKDGCEPTQFPGSALAVATAAGRNYAHKDGKFIVVLKKKLAEPILLDSQKMWQQGVVDPIKNMPMIPVDAPPAKTN